MTFSFALVSDLHLEGSHADFNMGGARLLAAVGDIYAPYPGMKPGDMHPAIEWLSRKAGDATVLFVPGNHDYEGNRVFDALSIMRECSKGTNVHVLWNDTFDFEGVRFLGTPLFTDFSLSSELSSLELAQPLTGTDMSRSFDEDGQPLTGNWMIKQNRIARTFLETELDRDAGMDKVVLTHWCPTPQAVDERFKDDKNRGYWISPCEDLADKAVVWCHGHVHKTVDVRVGHNPRRGWITSNPRGFSKLFNLATNADFIQPKLIQL